MVIGNHEITTQKRKKKNVLPHRNWNHGPLEQKASMQPMSFTDLFRVEVCHCCFKMLEAIQIVDLIFRQLKYEKISSNESILITL